MKKNKTSDFRKILEPLLYGHDLRTVFDAFVRLSACALAAQTRESDYLEEAKRWKPDELKVFGDALGSLILEMEQQPFTDVLGGYYMEFALSTKGQQWNGEFHTPKPICDLMARLTVDPSTFPQDRPVTVLEPACGAGAMILSLVEACPPNVRHRIRVTAIDINRAACDMCFINTSLWNIPCRVFHGDTLRMEMWHAWSNFPLMMSPLAIPPIDNPTEQGQPPKPPEVEQVRASLKQLPLAI